MKITAYNYNNFRNKQKSQSFGAEVRVGEYAEEFLKRDIQNLYAKSNFFQRIRYFGFTKFNPDKVVNKYIDAIQDATDNITGKIYIVMNMFKRKPEVLFEPFGPVSTFRSPENKLITLSATDILADRMFSFINPMKHAQEMTKQKLTDLLFINKCNYNPFDNLKIKISN